MKKFLSFVLAIAMVMSLTTFQIFPDAKAAAPSLPTSDEIYGVNAKGLEGIKITYEETSHTPHTVGNTIEYTVTVTNSGANMDFTNGSNVKVEFYNNGDNFLKNNAIFSADKVSFPKPNSSKFSVTEAKVDGTICGKENPEISAPKGHNVTIKKDSDSLNKVLMGAGTTITLNVSVTVQKSDVENGLIRNLIVVYLGNSEGSCAVGKYIEAEVYDETENVGHLTVSNVGGGGTDAEVYTITLLDNRTYMTPVGTKTDFVFSGGVATVRLKQGGSATGVVPAGRYTVTVRNAGDKNITYSLDDTTETAGKVCEGAMAMGENHKVVFHFREISSTTEYTLIYHLNVPDGCSLSSAKTSFTGQGDEFEVKELTKVFGADKKEAFKDLEDYRIEVEGEYYYFCGWSTSDLAITQYSDITYPITEISGSKRGYASPETHVIEEGTSDELYAVWLKNPGVMGYSMSVQGGHFKSWAETGSQKLGNNGLTNTKTPETAADSTLPHAQKVLVYDGGHIYKDKITVTPEIPELTGYTFVTWFNKAANKIESGKNDPNSDYIVQPGGEIKFGNTRNIYSLDAVWGKVEGAKDTEYKYDGTLRKIDVSDLQSFIWGSNYKDDKESTPSTAFKGLFGVGETEGKLQTIDPGKLQTGTLKYTYEVRKDGKTVAGPGAGDIPQFSEPGVYVYTITAELVGVDPTNGKEPGKTVDLKIGTVSATLTITPVESLKVTKYVINGEDPDEEFKFTVTLGGEAGGKAYTYRKLDADGEEIVGAGGKITDSTTLELKDEQSVVFDNLPDNTTYTVDETNLCLGYKKSVTGDASGTITEDNKEVSVIFTNTYETGDLTISKTVTGISDPDGYKFTVTLKDSEDTALTGSFACTGISGTASVKSGDEVTLKAGESIVIHDLPVGTRYTVIENGCTEYTTSVNNNGTNATGKEAKGEIGATSGAAVAFTNARKSGNLTVTKEIANGVQVDKTFTFTVRSSTEFDGTVALEGGKNVTFTKGEATVDVPVDGSKGSVTLMGLPEGTYTVTETTTGSFTTEYAPATATVEAGKTAQVKVTNTYSTGELTVTKNVESNNSDPSAQPSAKDEYKIHVTFAHGSTALKGFVVSIEHNGVTTKETVFGENTTVTISLKKDESFTLSGIPYGVHYEISEAFTSGEQGHYEVSYVGNAADTISETNKNPSVTVKNKYYATKEGTGTLWVLKRVQGIPDGSEPAQEYPFKVTFEQNTAPNKAFSDFLGTLEKQGVKLDPTGNSGTFSLANGHSKVIYGIPMGVTYKVEEIFEGSSVTKPANVVVEKADGDEDAVTTDGVYDELSGKMSVPTASGVVSAATRDVDGFTFYNQFLHDLTLEVITDDTVPDGTEFTFTLKFSGLRADQVRELMEIKDANGIREKDRLFADFEKDDTVTITLRKSRAKTDTLKAVIYNVPIGVSNYEFIEFGSSVGDEVEWDVGENRVDAPSHEGEDTDDQPFTIKTSYVTFKNIYTGGGGV